MSQPLYYRTLVPLLLTLVLLASSTLARAEQHHYTVKAPDGVTLAVQETGNPAGSPIIFIHGLLGSRLNWAQQLDDPALQRHRLITYDLRGHGLSGKPTQASAYTEGRRWADDLAVIIEALGVDRPVLVGWSLGGAVITNYLAAYGDNTIAGAVYVDGVVELKPDQITPHPEVYRDMISPDLQTHLDGERTFLGLCFYHQPERPIFARLLANAALASWTMQRAVMSLTIPAADGLSNTTVPLLFIYGAHDALIKPEPAIARARTLNPRIESRIYNDSGHAPFLEESDHFNRDLNDFIDRINSA
ncbi:alpha/beta fold hydrolase [Kushneria phosphatilytica]|uniref:Alpha/beta hydrolase n=1 Tax=Kushneria phosphatilytica TaxID=657387 RepID=A0A1S1NZJ8_9GAMM|nr:alpha/beta hydrolase [Kushneria phosphatilytica]OHV13914.1 alpha/beta hydrolase [Kushneria phosphatilytica]QEL10474.1 alpha/beta hydrolase [Kushneria phosphatilytica]